MDIDDLHIFCDAGVSGRRRRRDGLDAMLRALNRGEVDVVITFATNRLHRKIHLALAFVEEQIVEKRRRAVFVTQNLDTADQKFWKALLYVFAMLDEFGVMMTAGHVREAHIGLMRRSLVHGTLSFGYVGKPIEGEFTKRGKPRCRYEIDETTSTWVLRVFDWFVHQRLGFSDIARRLKKEGAPPPPKVKKWSAGAVKYLLKNRRYIGDWSYGRTETVWQSGADYGRQFEKDAPSQEHREERLRIVEDAMFYAAEERIAAKEGRGGRPSHKGVRVRDVVMEVMWCPKHERQLTTCGANAHQAACLGCKTEEEPGKQFLFSSLNRKVTRRLLCLRLAEHVRADENLATMAVAAARRHAEALQSPDPEMLAELQREMQSLNGRIGFVMDNPGESETDRAENGRQLAKLRSERARLERDIAQHREASAIHREIPSEKELQDILDELGEVLTRAAESEDEEELGKAMSVVLDLTGGRVTLSQQGERRPKQGWLRGTFHLQLLATLMNRAGCPTDGGEEIGEPIEIDFREPSPAERLADSVKSLWDQNLLVKQIARTLSEQEGEPVSRNLTRLAVAHWFTSRGLPVPDGRSRRSNLSEKTVDPSLPKRIADGVMKLFNQNLLLSEIANRLGVNPDTVTAAVRHWHESQGLPVPDGRSRRRTLGRMTSPAVAPAPFVDSNETAELPENA